MKLLINGESEYKIEIDKGPHIGSISISYINFFYDGYTELGLETKARSLVDTGNDVTICLDGKKIKLNYSQQEELFILLKLWKKELENGPNLPYKIVEIIEEGEL